MATILGVAFIPYLYVQCQRLGEATTRGKQTAQAEPSPSSARADRASP
jgi:hypothetical protein